MRSHHNHSATPLHNMPRRTGRRAPARSYAHPVPRRQTRPVVMHQRGRLAWRRRSPCVRLPGAARRGPARPARDNRKAGGERQYPLAQDGQWSGEAISAIRVMPTIGRAASALKTRSGRRQWIVLGVARFDSRLNTWKLLRRRRAAPRSISACAATKRGGALGDLNIAPAAEVAHTLSMTFCSGSTGILDLTVFSTVDLGAHLSLRRLGGRH